MELTEAENKIQQAALEFARTNKKSIAKRLTAPEIYIPEKFSRKSLEQLLNPV